ncbi:hypothetical protein N7495_003947 [Penicillium taxi]|uniref:uncharacterized protein n=1 Tax=Penicillium taxi TaxID=168475 RepID=UPI002544D86B|nr:uncharacterized protein N7495_003947 [Penicillium taxi]KAJ5899203.1 hypothetical protein N7495_003947 [Penicillium taxi]
MAPKQESRKKRLPLTHFLCLPLVNTTSIPQLEASITAFRAAYPPVRVVDLPKYSEESGNGHTSHPVIPVGAVRPLGTLHLTLGVMSLPTKERLEEALAFFESIDIAKIMHEVKPVASQPQDKFDTPLHPVQSGYFSVPSKSGQSGQSILNTDQPFIVNLESLHALPRAEAATVLYASPSDPTERLYPFCVMLRDKFIKAGFLQEEMAQKPNSHSRKPEPRPLLLHATLINTIYVRQPKNHQNSTQRGKRPKRIEIDARDLLERYQNYYIDEQRTKPRMDTTTSIEPENKGSSTENTISEPQFPFLWAREISLESISICEMGAKKLPKVDSRGNPQTLNARLGEKYTLVAQRSLYFKQRPLY